MDLEKEFALSRSRLAIRLDADVRAAEKRINRRTPTEIKEGVEAVHEALIGMSKWFNAISAGFVAFGDAYTNELKEDHGSD